MNSFTRPNRAAATIACAFSATTAWLVLGDLPGPTSITPTHTMALLAIAGAVYFGHGIMPVLRDRRPFIAVAMLALTVGFTTYVCLAAGIRYAATATARAAQIEAANAARRQADIDAAAARALHREAQGDEKTECVKVGPQCGRKAERTAAAWSHVLIADAKRAQLGAIEEPDAGIHAAAQALAMVPGMPAADSIAASLAHGLPWLLVIITELAAIVAWSRALPAQRHARAAVMATPATVKLIATAQAASMPAQLPTPATIAALPAPVPTTGALAMVAALRRHGRAATLAEAAALMGVSRGEASRRWREAAGAIVSQRDGRRLLLTLA